MTVFIWYDNSSESADFKQRPIINLGILGNPISQKVLKAILSNYKRPKMLYLILPPCQTSSLGLELNWKIGMIFDIENLKKFTL